MKELLIILSLINFSGTSDVINNKSKREMIDAIGDCSAIVVRRLYFFEQNINVVQDPVYNMPMKFYVDLSKDFKFVMLDSNDFDDNSILNYIVISHRLPHLYKKFEEFSYDLFSRILIITTLSFDVLLAFVNYLNSRKYVFVTFLIIDDDQSLLKVYQTDNNCSSCDRKVTFNLTGYCGLDGSLVEVRKTILPFSEILCPAHTCNLRFIRVDHGATKEELYNYSENGTEIAADSYGGCVLETFAAFYNISITSKDYVSNYTWNRTIKAMKDGYADVGFGPTLPYSNLVTDVQKGTAYTYEEFLFIDVLHKSNSSLSQLLMPLSKEVWICFCLVMVSFLIFLVLFRRFERNHSARTNLRPLHFLAVLLNQYIRLPTKLGIRVVIGMWLLYALLMNAIYNCNFVSSLIKVQPKDMLNTFDELRKSNRRFGGPDVVREWLNEPSDPIMMDLYNRYEIINPDDVDIALRNMNMVVAQTDYMIFKIGMADFYLLNEKIVSYPLLYYMPRSHPHYKFINQFMERIRAGKIPLAHCETVAQEKRENTHRFVTLIHLQVIFEALLILNFISFFLFLLEYFTSFFND